MLCISIFNILYNSLGHYLSNFLPASFSIAKESHYNHTFSRFFEHKSPLFKDLNVIKLFDEVTVHIAVFMYKFKYQPLSANFNVFFTSIKETHDYNTRI